MCLSQWDIMKLLTSSKAVWFGIKANKYHGRISLKDNFHQRQPIIYKTIFKLQISKDCIRIYQNMILLASEPLYLELLLSILKIIFWKLKIIFNSSWLNILKRMECQKYLKKLIVFVFVIFTVKFAYLLLKY